ncbi:hypothetical protein K3495_g4376 [Podosphaera aphanis]|nr:hypothetical protein K3495_g4376 [Podosphaera aphanis]
MQWSLKGFKLAIFPERTPFFAAAKTHGVGAKKAYTARYPIPSSLQKKSASDNLNIQSEPDELCSFRKPNILDKITEIGGSKKTFLAILLLVEIWAVAGFFCAFDDTWQIIFQNASSIQVYVTDILLIRQQQNSSRVLLTKIAELQSRLQTVERLLRHISSTTPTGPRLDLQRFDTLSYNEAPVGKISRTEYMWNCTCAYVARALGSIWAFILYWIGIGVWGAVGPSQNYNDTWQLYINTATAVILTFTSVFLQNLQQNQEEKLEKCLEHILKSDAMIEKRLRSLTGDQTPNPIFTIPVPNRTFTERNIDKFADIMGSGLGVTISVLFTIAWISVGPTLEFQDNWWLIIGTFTGLVGFIDGFVLRSLYYREEKYAKAQFESLAENEDRIFEELQLVNKSSLPPTLSFADRISLTISNACGHRYASVGAVALVVGLLATATGMGWTVTGQLLCNTTTMIIEGFFLLILIQAHNKIYEEREIDLEHLLKGKEMLDDYVYAL